MEEYIVSARKYRPINFDSVVGQRALTTTLKNAIASNKLAHAYLFCGPRGVGKTTCARIFAKAINCMSPKEGGDACGECESCKAFDQQRSMNIHELDAASNNSVEDIRELIKQVQIPPQIGRYKVFIIDEVHMLSSSAFNAFLKTLEEPPSYVIFILATTEKHKILPTILSRCQVYDFQRMTTQNTVDHLMYVAQKEGYNAQPEALSLIAEKADGGMRDALSIFDQMVSFTGGELTYEKVCQSLNVLSSNYYFKLVDHFLKNEVEPCLLLFNEILQKGFDGGNFIGGMASHLRNLLVSRDEVTLPLLEMSDQMRARYQEQAMRCQPRFLYRAIKLCNDCDQAYRTSRNKRLQVEICLIQAAQLTDESSPDGGLGPIKILKPIFAKLAKNQQASANEPKVSASIRPEGSKPTTVAPTAIVEHSASASSTSSNNSNSGHILKKVSLKHFGISQTKANAQQNAQQTQEEIQENVPLTEISFQNAWNEFIVSLPHGQVALAQRMRMMHPVIKDATAIEIELISRQVQTEMEEIRETLEGTLRRKLHNKELHFIFKVEEDTNTNKIYNKAEHLKIIQEQNPAVKMLVKELQLVLD